MQSYVLSDQERIQVSLLVDTVAAGLVSVEDEEFVAKGARLASAELPAGLREAVLEFRTYESSAGLRISGWEVDDAVLPETPTRPRPVNRAVGTLRHDVYFYLVSELLGDPIGWATQQQGRMMHDIFPVKSRQNEQIGWSSDTVLTWHTEDAFHPYRAEYLGLCCLRNPTCVGTTYADVHNLAVSAAAAERLRQPSFIFLADDAHTEAGGSMQRGSILFGDPQAPYLRLDPEYMQVPDDADDRAAIAEISEAIDNALQRASLEPGDLLFIDNFRAVHGRERFEARFDGTDRWLRRMNIARDLRKSRDARRTAHSRVIA